MTPFFISFLTCFSAIFRSRYNLGLEITANRQQPGVLKRKQPRPRLRMRNRIFWILLRRISAQEWQQAVNRAREAGWTRLDGI